MVDLKMRYKHDCDKCKPLGSFSEFDLYFCNQGGELDTVIARYGNDKWQYFSGLGPAMFPLEIAKAMAVELGFMDNTQTIKHTEESRMKVFLGGTCNNSTWRDELIPMLTIDYFNPVVEDWTEECMAEEIKQREECDFCLYVITPEMTGVYSIAEVVDDSNKRPHKTLFCFLQSTSGDALYFSPAQIKSLKQVTKMVRDNGGYFADTLEMAASYLNVTKG